jgi:hypothetical protein
MPNKERQSGIGRWIKSHHANWFAWVLIILGIVFAIAMLARIAQQQ